MEDELKEAFKRELEIFLSMSQDITRRVLVFPCINSLITPLTSIITFRIIQGLRAIFIFILILQVYFTFNFNEITAELQRSHYINYYL